MVVKRKRRHSNFFVQSVVLDDYNSCNYCELVSIIVEIDIINNIPFCDNYDTALYL